MALQGKIKKKKISPNRTWTHCVCQGQAVNSWYYLEVLKRLRENVRRKIPQLWRNNSWFLHHDNVPAHASLLIHAFLANTNTAVLPQPSYTPDLAPADFFLYPLKSTLK
jgi:transposase